MRGGECTGSIQWYPLHWTSIVWGSKLMNWCRKSPAWKYRVSRSCTAGGTNFWSHWWTLVLTTNNRQNAQRNLEFLLLSNSVVTVMVDRHMRTSELRLPSEPLHNSINKSFHEEFGDMKTSYHQDCQDCLEYCWKWIINTTTSDRPQNVLLRVCYMGGMLSSSFRGIWKLKPSWRSVQKSKSTQWLCPALLWLDSRIHNT